MDALVEPVLETVEIETELADAEAARQAFERLIRTIVTQPAASKMYFELYAAGPAGVALAERLLDGFTALGQRLLGFERRRREDAGGDRRGADRRCPEGDPQAPQRGARGGAGGAGAAALGVADQLLDFRTFDGSRSSEGRGLDETPRLSEAAL